MQDLIMYIVLGYIVFSVIKSGALGKLRAFFGLVKSSAQQQGARGTLHSVLDGAFDAAGTLRTKASSAGKSAKAKADSLRPAEYEYNAQHDELSMFLDKLKTVQLILSRGESGVEAVLMNISGSETPLGQRKLRQYLEGAAKGGRLSEAQAKAIADYMRRK